MDPKKEMTPNELWGNFISSSPCYKNEKIPPAFYFCDNKKDADECALLVQKGIKQATTTSLWWFEKNEEPLPRVGNLYMVTDWEGFAKAIIEVTKVKKVRFNEITSEYAAVEGEGDGSLAYWKKVHKAYYEREMAPYSEKFEPSQELICEYFKKVY